MKRYTSLSASLPNELAQRIQNDIKQSDVTTSRFFLRVMEKYYQTKDAIAAGGSNSPK